LKGVKRRLIAAPPLAVDLLDLLGQVGLALIVDHVLLFAGGSICGGGCGVRGVGSGSGGRGCGGGGGGGGIRSSSSGCACGSTRQAHQAASQDGQKEQRTGALHADDW